MNITGFLFCVIPLVIQDCIITFGKAIFIFLVHSTSNFALCFFLCNKCVGPLLSALADTVKALHLLLPFPLFLTKLRALTKLAINEEYA